MHYCRTAAGAVLVALLHFGLVVLPQTAGANPSRTVLKGPVRVSGREVKELILSTPIQAGRKLPPGLPTTDTYKVLPNRFLPAAEDKDGFFFQAVQRFRDRPMGYSPQLWHAATAGGLYVTKTQPLAIAPYSGDARNPPTSATHVTGRPSCWSIRSRSL